MSAATASEVVAATSQEGFDYSPGSEVAGQAGGIGWAAAWTAKNGNGTLINDAGSLTYPGIVSTGGKMSFTGVGGGTGTSTNTFRILAAPLTEGTTHYIHILAQNLNEGRRFFGVAFFDGSTERILLGQASTSPNWTINHVDGFPATNNTLDSTVDSSAPALLVLKLELLSGVERVTFWVNPDLSVPENVATAVGGTAYMTDNDFGQVTRIRIGGGGYSATLGGDPTDHYLDEISITTGSPFADPYTYWIGGFGIALAADREPDADPDGDRLVNAQEFYLNTNPTTHSAIVPTKVGGNMHVAFQRRDDAKNLPVKLETSATLGAASWLPVEDGVNGVVISVFENGSNPDDVLVIVPSPLGRNFARFKLTFN